MTIKIVGNSSARIFRFTSSTTITWTITYDVLASASTATYTNPVTAGSSMTINISNSSMSTSSLTHTINFSIGSYSDSISLGAGVVQRTYTIPSTWANAIQNADSGICAMTLSTYSNGTYIGSRSYSVTILVPSSSDPTIGIMAALRIDNTVPSSWGIYVQGKSGTYITASDCAGSNGSTITRYSISGGMSSTTTGTQTGCTFVLNPIQSSGTIPFTITVTDSRGRSASRSTSIYVYPYAVPTITSTSAYKSTADGTRSSTGTYLAIKMSATCSSLNNNNTLSLSGYYRVMGTSTWSAATT